MYDILGNMILRLQEVDFFVKYVLVSVHLAKIENWNYKNGGQWASWSTLVTRCYVPHFHHYGDISIEIFKIKKDENN